MKKLMNEQDFKNSQPYLFHKSLGQKAREKLVGLWNTDIQNGIPGDQSCKLHQAKQIRSWRREQYQGND